MVQFNTRANEILLKLVYYGPGLSGKTTNLQALHAMCSEGSRGELFSVNTQEDRTLFFDLLPINLGYIYGNAIHLQIYTVPGQVQYDASRRVVLNGADGVVFVADSSEGKMQDNVDSLSNLYHNLNANRLNIKQIPFVIQYNKRDLPDAMPVGVMNRRLNFRNVPYFESTAFRGVGVLDTFLSIVRDTVGTTFRKYHLDKKIKDFDEMLRLIENNIHASMRALPEPDEAPMPQPERTILRHANVSVADLAPDKAADASELLEDALKSNMETARLYSELKQSKDALDKKNEELNQLYTQLEKANQDNLKTRRYLEGLVQSVGEAIVSFSHDGRILTWNAAAERIFGYPRGEIVGHSLGRITPPDRHGELEQVVAQVGAGNLLRNVPTLRLRKSGEAFPCTITYAPIRGNDDRVLAFSAVIRDTGEQQALERRLKESEEGSGLARIMPTLVNEIGNRLASLLVNKSLLQEGGDLANPRVNRLVQSLENSVGFLRPMMLLLSPTTPDLAPGNLNQLVQEAARRVETERLPAGVTLDLVLDPQLPATMLDGEQVREALVQLFRGRLGAVAQSGARRMRLTSRLSGQALQLLLHDSGAALPEHQWAKVFDLAEAPDADALSLCITAHVVRAHGGRVTLRSQEGSGNAFLLEFPLSEVVAAPPVAGLQGARVLVVDDERFLLECMVDAISSWGAQVTPCELAAEAIQKLQEAPFDLIVSDIRMPGLSGIQFFEWIQAHRPQMAQRIIYTTGDSFDPETRGFLESASLPYLGKPFDLKRLRSSLEQLLGAP